MSVTTCSFNLDDHTPMCQRLHGVVQYDSSSSVSRDVISPEDDPIEPMNDHLLYADQVM